MSLRPRRAMLAAPLAVVAFAAAAPATSHAATHGTQAKTKNANFKGKWVMSLGYSFTIKKEDTATGKCTGTQSYGNEYKLVDCKVHGHHFKFQIVAKSDGAYSDYHGKFTKHKLHGVWAPEGSGGETFTATRAKVK